mgnify:CR=1 FL=1
MIPSQMNYLKINCLFFSIIFLSYGNSYAFEHHDSHVNFLEYNKNIIFENKVQKKPYFLLFAAEWCHWCHIFAEKTLKKKKIYSYLNKNFVNIFIDADIHSSAYKKFKANGVPYTVFLNPDSSVYYKYSGTLYEEPFFEVIEGVVKNIKRGVNVDGEEIIPFEYVPPKKLELSSLYELEKTFINGLLDNLDWKEYGLGKREKAILPETYIYFLNSTDGKEKEDAVLWTSKTLSKAIENIYDPIEGGFFRFAETRDWDIPHFEKMADLNAGIILLLYKMDQLQPKKSFKKIATQTTAYLSETLYDDEVGSFLSFQEADNYYYFFNAKNRKNQKFPHVIKNIYINNLSVTLSYLIDVLDYTNDENLKNKIKSSIDFLYEMLSKNKKPLHYFNTTKKQWLGEGDLQDFALLTKLFHKAARKFNNKKYMHVSSNLINISIAEYFNEKKQIFVDPELDENDFEYLMGINSIFTSIFLENQNYIKDKKAIKIESLIAYFSGMNELLEDRFWESKDLGSLENYALFLNSYDKFIDYK